MRLYQKWYRTQSRSSGSDAVLSPSPKPTEAIPLADVLGGYKPLDLLVDLFSSQIMNFGNFSLDIVSSFFG